MLGTGYLVIGVFFGSVGCQGTYPEEYSFKDAYPKIKSCTDFTRTAHIDRYRHKDNENHEEVLTNLTSEGGRRRRDAGDQSLHLVPYLPGIKGQALQLAPSVVIPAINLTIDLWVKAEGGQHPGAPILDLYDKCHPSQKNGWRIGIASQEPGKATFFFSIRTDRNPRTTVLPAPDEYDPQKWTHLAATYDGINASLYVHGVLVKANHGQKGPLFSNITRECKVIRLGDKVQRNDALFRGSVDGIRIWNKVLSNAEIHRLKDHHGRVLGPLVDGNVADGDIWVGADPNPVIKWHSRRAKKQEIETLVIPKCGETICDNPAIVHRYSDSWKLKQQKTVKYTIVNIADDDGLNPALTESQIALQDTDLRRTFKPYNITWRLEVTNVNSSFIKAKTIMAGCPVALLGNGLCDPECDHPATNNDAGDCGMSIAECQWLDVENGMCDPQCNNQINAWDGGDCCFGSGDNASELCLDPASEYRSYLMLDDLRRMVGLTNSDSVVVHLAEWSVGGSIGFATFPWDNDAFTARGGVVVKHSVFGRQGVTGTLIHELGHALGLWHVHHGVTEMECNDPCLETAPSMVLGDLCSDTNPTNEHTTCGNPADGNSPCAVPSMAPTPYRNYMSYAGDDCYEEFSPQQAARMHCHLDLLLGGWLHGSSAAVPSIQAFPPQVMKAGADFVHIHWHQSLNHRHMRGPSPCDQCTEDDALVQYAYSALSPSTTVDVQDDHYWAPHQALGAPNAEPCKEFSFRAWSPDPSMCGALSYTRDSLCVLELDLKYPVIPHSIEVWIPWLAEGILHDLQLFWSNGDSKSFGSLPVQCHSPLTITLLEEIRLLTKVRLLSKTSLVSVDAMVVTSKAQSKICQTCTSVAYLLHRSPPFEDGTADVVAPTTSFTDRSVQSGVTYEYSVKTKAGTKVAEYDSPVLVYRHGQSFCGDGTTDRHEECDDGNLKGGDGCNQACRLEAGYKCSGSPAVCYIPASDAQCEDAELSTFPCDCGHFTPVGYMDQWPVSVEDLTDPTCPVHSLIGAPNHEQLCLTCGDPRLSSVATDLAWMACADLFVPSTYYNRDTSNWLQVTFSRPVVPTAIILYAVSSRTPSNDFWPNQDWVTISLLGHNRTILNTQKLRMNLTCDQMPIVSDLGVNLNTEFRHAMGLLLKVPNPDIVIAAVGLRSHLYFDPITLSTCGLTGGYDPYSGTCLSSICGSPQCEPLFLKYTTVNCNGYNHGDTCQVVCLLGYKYETGLDWSWKLASPVCIDGDWVGVPRCEPVDCGVPVVPDAEQFCDNGHTLGSKCKLDCISPAKKTGPPLTIECKHDGMWSFPESYCLVRCKNSPAVKNATLSDRLCAYGEHSIGKRCDLQCLPGYHVAGQGYDDRTTYLECTEQGTWRGASCVPVQCPSVSAALTGLYSCTNGRNAGSFCTIKCPKPSTTVTKLECLTTGEWSRDPGTCVFSTEPCPTLLNTPELLFNCPNPSPVGSVCSVQCMSYDRIPVLSAAPSQDTQDGDNRKRVDALTCISSQQWFPTVTDILCLDRCQEEFTSDGYCDPANNHAHCQWDGGDCCPSTVDGGVVRPFPSQCTHECACVDPRAEENRRLNRVRRQHGVNHARPSRNI